MAEAEFVQLLDSVYQLCDNIENVTPSERLVIGIYIGLKRGSKG